MDSFKQFFIEEIIDSSTFVGQFDVGFDIRIRKKLRLVGLSAFGMNDEERNKAIAYIESLVRGKTIWCKTLPDKYRKYATVLGVMYIQDGDNILNVNDHLIEKEFAKLRTTEPD